MVAASGVALASKPKFRADTMAGLCAGDVTIDNFGHLNVLIRHMKFRPAYHTQSGLMTIPSGPADQTVACA